MLALFESSKFVSNKKRISRIFNDKNDSKPMKLEWRPQILWKQSFRELCSSNLSSLHAFDNITISLWGKHQKAGMSVDETFMPDVIFVTFTGSFML